MIESGSHTPGVLATDFALPSFAALRYEQPAAALAPYLTDYHVLDSEGPAAQDRVDWMLPSWPAIRIILSDAPIAIRIGAWTFDPMPVAALYGTTSRALEVTSSGGVTIGAGITPLGWSRLFRQPASALRDRIVPLDSLWAPARVERLVTALAATLDEGRGVKATLDAFFLAEMAPPPRDEREIRLLMEMILDDEIGDLASMAHDIGIAPSRLRRLADRHFGFPPKTLRLRARFLRSFIRMILAGDDADYALISPSYHDASHFLRDANRFLGMTPRRFLARPAPYMRSAIRARLAVIGRATQALDDVAGDARPAE